MYLGGAISESADLDIEIKRWIGAAWASVRKYSSQLYDRRNARLSLKIRLFKAEVMEAMLYGYPTWTMRSQDFCSLRTATTSYSCALSAFGARTASGINPYCIGRFSRGPVPNASKRQFGSANLGSPGPLSDKATQGFQSESCLGGWRCKGPSEEVDRRRHGWTASRKIPRPSGRSRAKWVAFGVVVKDGRDWMTAAKNVGKWHRGVERGAEALDSAWRRADLRQSNVQHQREVSEVVQ